MFKSKREKLMCFEQIKEARNRVAAKLKNLENTDNLLELTLEELSAISGGNGVDPKVKTWCGAGCDKRL